LKLQIYFTIPQVKDDPLQDTSVVLIDVLRSTTTICHAVAAGCSRIFPVADLGQVTEFVEALGRDALVLGGEKDSRPIEGFDLGNSPREYTADRIGGRRVVLLTSNGTAALHRLKHLRSVWIASFVNLSAVATRLVELEHDVAICCAGHRDQFCLEDSLCAGMLAEKIMALRPGAEAANDAARVGLTLVERWRDDLAGCLRQTRHGQRLLDLGYEADLDACAALDTSGVLPVFLKDQIQPEAPVSGAAEPRPARARRRSG
jgi:2-phosphosulfolactate phosphatase